MPTPEEADLAVKLLRLSEWYRQDAIRMLRLDHRAWMEALGNDEIRLLWFAGQRDASYLAIAEGMGWTQEEVHLRILVLRRKLGARHKWLTRKEFDLLTRNVAALGGTISNPQTLQNSDESVELRPQKTA